MEILSGFKESKNFKKIVKCKKNRIEKKTKKRSNKKNESLSILRAPFFQRPTFEAICTICTIFSVRRESGRLEPGDNSNWARKGGTTKLRPTPNEVP